MFLSRAEGELGAEGIRTSATLRRLLNLVVAVALAIGAVLIAAAMPSSVFFLRAPGRAADPSTLVLRASVQATQEIPVQARLDGRVARRFVDVGDTVQTGQVLAEIDAPDLDQLLHQARATLAQAEASVAQARSGLRQARATLEHARAQLAHSRTTLARWRTLKERELVAQQDLDDRQILVDAGRAGVDAAQANVDALPASVAAAEANAVAARAQVERLVELQSSRQIRAPSAGVIVSRYVDVGGQVSSGSGSQGTPLFAIAPIDRLLVSVSLPQHVLAAIKPGMTAELGVAEFPQRTFAAQIVAIGAVDPASKTFSSEAHLLNEEQLLRPGMQADVTLRLPQQ